MKKKQTVRCGKQSSKALYFNQKLELCYLLNLLKTVKHDRFSRKNYPDFANNIYMYTEDLYNFSRQFTRGATPSLQTRPFIPD